MSLQFGKKFYLAWPLLFVVVACSQKRDEPDAPREEGSESSDQTDITDFGNIPIVLESSDAIPGVPKQAGTSQNPTPASTPAPTAAAKVNVTSSCAGNFVLQVTALDGSGSSSTSISAFSGCDILAAKLNGQKLPTGRSGTIVTPGPSVTAACNAGSLTLVIASGGNTFVDSLTVYGSDVCNELRELIHSAKI